jgi:SAM-dependent methyltransferase
MYNEEWFDKAAASWDENPGRTKLAKDVARAISEAIVLPADVDVLDFGCGTGLLTLALKPWVHSITGVDSSQGMLDMLNKKVAALNLDGVKTRLVDLARGDELTGTYDLVVSSMTLHHVEAIEPLVSLFHRILSPGGHLCIADLDPEGGRFHEDSAGIFHFGFEREALAGVFREAGFDDVRHVTAGEMAKPGADGGVAQFSVFLMTGQKKG